MPLYFFDVHDGNDVIDCEGTDLADAEDAKKEAAWLAAGLLRDNPQKFWKHHELTVRVSNDQRLVLFEITLLAHLAPSMMIGAMAGG